VRAGARLAECAADVVELAALSGQAGQFAELLQRRGLELPRLGGLRRAPERLTLAVRPGRWLLLAPRALAGATAAQWHNDCAQAGAAIDLSSGLTALYLAGAGVRELLARGCRLDLAPAAAPPGSAAATIIAQVAVTLAWLPSGVLLLTPASTARHLREWLLASGAPFALVAAEDVTVTGLCGDESS
jgi:heterotetrameric sarcosine oxidase gamma subunit